MDDETAQDSIERDCGIRDQNDVERQDEPLALRIDDDDREELRQSDETRKTHDRRRRDARTPGEHEPGHTAQRDAKKHQRIAPSGRVRFEVAEREQRLASQVARERARRGDRILDHLSRD